MPSKVGVKTYGKPKKIGSNYIPKPVSPFKITEASTAIDALFSKNIKKRKSIITHNEVKKVTGKEVKISELALQNTPVLTSDSLNIKVNSTFDDLMQGPVYNQVNICNTSSLYINNSTDTSNSKNTSSQIHYYHTRRKNKKKGICLEKSYNNSQNNIRSSGKIRKRKNNTRKFKKVIKNVVLNISDVSTNNHNISKKIHSYLDKSVNYSLILERVPNEKKKDKKYMCARKFTPIASTSKIMYHNDEIDKKDCDLLRIDFRHLTGNTPKLFHSSTPLVPRNIKTVDKVNLSPIRNNIKTTLNFTDNNSKSLFESNTRNFISSVNITSNNASIRNITNNVILINSTVPGMNNVDGSIIINDNVQTSNIIIPCTQHTYIEEIIHDDEIIIPKYDIVSCNSLIANDKKLKGKAIVRLERHLDILGIDGNKSLLCNFSRTKIKNVERIPVVYLERLSFSKYIKNCDIYVKPKPQLLRRSQSTIMNFNNSKKPNYSFYENEITNSNQISLPFNNSSRALDSNVIDSSITVSSEKYNMINTEHKHTRTFSTKKTKKKVPKSANYNAYDKNKEIYSNKQITSKNKIPSIIKDVQKKYNITTRRKKVRINVEPTNNNTSNESEKPQNISLNTWKIFSNCKVNLNRLEHLNYNYTKLNREETNTAISDNFDISLNKGNIVLKPGKQWFRSLSIFRRSNFYGTEFKDLGNSLEKNINEWNSTTESSNKFDDVHKINSSLRKIIGIRKSLKIVNISVKDSLLFEDDTELNKKSGYVSAFTDVSVLESFDKLSLSTSTDDREETAREIILKRCGQTEPISFNDCYSSRILKKCRKIGEGVYGEVFMYKNTDNKCRVIKIIPIEGNVEVNGERQKKFEEIISEIIIATELSNLRINKDFCTNGFAELLQVYCVQGRYPQHLLELWDLFDEQRGSENDSPEIFTKDQLYIVLELANGGQDLESYRFNNAEQSYALFVQVVCSLAVAESALQFEHRDMHWGNILILPSDDVTTTYRLNGRKFEIATKGVKVSIIDYTLSRMTYNNCCIYNDLATDPDLFAATGDYQFDIYRLMKQRNQNEWQIFEPYTNILWLDYILDKMIRQVRYLRENTKTHKTYIRRLSQIRKKILHFNSAIELLNSDIFSHMFL